MSAMLEVLAGIIIVDSWEILLHKDCKWNAPISSGLFQYIPHAP